MVYFSLILGNKCNSRENELLCSSIKHTCLPRVGENIAFDGHKFEVIRVIYDFNDVEKRKTIVVVAPVSVSEEPKQDIIKTEPNNDFYDASIAALII